MTQAAPHLNGTSQNAAPAAHASPAAPAVVAAIHRQADRWRLVILENRTGLTLLQATSVDSEAQIPPLLGQYQVERVIRVAPARQTVARCVPVPAGDAEELAPALALLAEAQLPESIPAHRRAAGIIPESEGLGRTALLTGWQGDPPADLPDESEEVETSWTTPAAALAALRHGQGQSAVYADPDEGAISILVFGNKSIARVLVEDAPNPSAFARAVGSVVSETCAAAGVAAPATPLAQSGIVLSIDNGVIASVRAAVSNLSDQRSWYEQYGIALGAAIGALSTDPTTRALSSILAAAPIRRESPPERAANWLSRRRNAWALIAVSAAIILLGPLAIAWARLAVLESKAVGLGDRNRERTESSRRTALYRQLEQSRWPMTKLLGDITAAIPIGITAESIRLAPDQGLAIQGSADSPELVNTMHANLTATKLLGSVKLNRIESSGERVEFDLTAEVLHPHTKAAGVEDFASKPLAVRLYGEGASNTAMPKNITSSRESAASREPRPIASRPAPERTERSERSSDRGGDRSERGSRSSEAPTRPAASAPGEAPPPLTDDQIAKMDRSTAMKEWVNRKTFPQKNPTLDAGTKSRLEEEVRKLREQMDKAQGGAA